MFLSVNLRFDDLSNKSIEYMAVLLPRKTFFKFLLKIMKKCLCVKIFLSVDETMYITCVAVAF